MLAVQGLDFKGSVFLADYVGDLGAEMIFTTLLDYSVPDVLHDLRKAVGTDVRMGIDQDLRVRSE